MLNFIPSMEAKTEEVMSFIESSQNKANDAVITTLRVTEKELKVIFNLLLRKEFEIHDKIDKEQDPAKKASLKAESEDMLDTIDGLFGKV